jgi:hypothetical protein
VDQAGEDLACVCGFGNVHVGSYMNAYMANTRNIDLMDALRVDYHPPIQELL